MNKTKVMYGIPRDPDVAAVLQQMEIEEADSNTFEDKPKVTLGNSRIDLQSSSARTLRLYHGVCRRRKPRKTWVA